MNTPSDGSKVGLFLRAPDAVGAMRGPLAEDDSPAHVTFLILGDLRAFGGPEVLLEALRATIQAHPSRCWAVLDRVRVSTNTQGQKVAWQEVRFEDGGFAGHGWPNLCRMRDALVADLRNVRGMPIKDHSPDNWTPHFTRAYLPPDAEVYAQEPIWAAWAVNQIEVWGYGEPLCVDLRTGELAPSRGLAFELIKALSPNRTPSPRVGHRIPSWLGALLEARQGLAKGASHKYIRKVPTGKSGKMGKPLFRYYYTVGGGAGLGHHDEFKVGAAFAVKDAGKAGHFHITEEHSDGTVTIKHDESGKSSRVAKDALRSMLHNEHAKAIGDARERASKILEQAKKTGTKKQQERAEEAARRAGAHIPEPRPEPPIDKNAKIKKLENLDIGPKARGAINAPPFVADLLNAFLLQGGQIAVGRTILNEKWARSLMEYNIDPIVDETFNGKGFTGYKIWSGSIDKGRYAFCPTDQVILSEPAKKIAEMRVEYNKGEGELYKKEDKLRAPYRRSWLDEEAESDSNTSTETNALTDEPAPFVPPSQIHAGADVQGGAPSGLGRAQSAATRSRPRSRMELQRPVVGPSGAKLTAYEWQHKLVDDVDKRGEDRVRRVSDWDKAAPSEHTGRDIVHHFEVVMPSGEAKTVSAESALDLLGYTSKSERAKVRGLADDMIEHAQASARLDELESANQRFVAAHAAVSADPSTPRAFRPARFEGMWAHHDIGGKSYKTHATIWGTMGDNEKRERMASLHRSFVNELAAERAGLGAVEMRRLESELRPTRERVAALRQRLNDKAAAAGASGALLARSALTKKGGK